MPRDFQAMERLARSRGISLEEVLLADLDNDLESITRLPQVEAWRGVFWLSPPTRKCDNRFVNEGGECDG